MGYKEVLSLFCKRLAYAIRFRRAATLLFLDYEGRWYFERQLDVNIQAGHVLNELPTALNNSIDL